MGNLVTRARFCALRTDGGGVKRAQGTGHFLGAGPYIEIDTAEIAEPGPAVLCGLELVEKASELGLPPARFGINSGPVVFQDGDYFGRTVNVAARIADYARPGEVLVSDAVAASEVDGVAYREIGPIALKGTTSPVTLHVASRS